MMRSTMPEDDVLRSSEESPDDVSTKAGRQHAPPQPLEGRSPRDRSGHGNHDEPIIDIEHIVSNGAGTVELSVIEEGRSYARITYDDATAEHMYEVVEPRLNEDELAAFELLKKALIISLNAPSDPSPEHRRKMLDKAVDRLTSTLGLTLRPVSRERILYHLHRDFIGYGPITVMMADPDIEDISCNGVGVPLFVYHRKYGSIRTNVIYEDEAELDRYVIWLAQRCGKHISLARPMLDATIPDGSRLNATLGRHVTKRGSSFTIRRFKDDPFTPVDLIGFNTMSTEMMAYLWISVEFGSSMIVCGGTASGKTSTLNALMLFIPPQMKIVSIEDTRELNLPHENWVPGLTREGFSGMGDNGGSIDMFDLLTAALRQRPQYLMVGEVRGKEAYVIFQAMATGHTTYSTMHADSVQSMVNRLENEPINLPRSLLSSLDLVLLQGQVKVGSNMARRVRTLTEIVGLDPETGELIANTVFYWNPADDSFTYSGHSYIYEKVRAVRNWSSLDMEREVKRRIDILEYMKRIGVENYRQVAKIVSAYYKEPDKVIEEVRAKLSE